MQGKHLYEYAVIRFLPKIEREEFFNIGLILFSKRENYLKVDFKINKEKLNSFPTELDMDSIQDYLQIFDKICTGDSSGGDIALLDIPERFRWLTAVRSTSIQTSRPHAGFTDDLDVTFHTLYRELVL